MRLTSARPLTTVQKNLKSCSTRKRAMTAWVSVMLTTVTTVQNASATMTSSQSIPVVTPPRKSAVKSAVMMNILMQWESLNTASGAPLYSTRGPSQISVSASPTSKGWAPTSQGMISSIAAAAGMSRQSRMNGPVSCWMRVICSMEKVT